MSLSEAVEDYLKAIYLLQQEHARVSTSQLAKRLRVAPASVTAMMKKLAGAKPKLVEHRRHHGVVLTPAGEKKALEIIRHHRLLETYLHDKLGLPWDKVHAEAERLEHFISELVEDRIAAILGEPEFDPHGDPIPGKDGRMPDTGYRPLRDLAVGDRGRVRRVSDDAEMLRYLTTLGIGLDAEIEVTDRAPFDGPLHVKVGAGDDAPVHAVGGKLAGKIFVESSRLPAEKSKERAGGARGGRSRARAK